VSKLLQDIVTKRFGQSLGQIEEFTPLLLRLEVVPKV
jgi:hypothetical protein